MTNHASQVSTPRIIDDLKKVLYGAACIGIVYGVRASMDPDTVSLTDETPEGKKASEELSKAVSLLANATVSLVSRAYTSFFRIRMQPQNDEDDNVEHAQPRMR